MFYEVGVVCVFVSERQITSSVSDVKKKYTEQKSRLLLIERNQQV